MQIVETQLSTTGDLCWMEFERMLSDPEQSGVIGRVRLFAHCDYIRMKCKEFNCTWKEKFDICYCGYDTDPIALKFCSSCGMHGYECWWADTENMMMMIKK